MAEAEVEMPSPYERANLIGHRHVEQSVRVKIDQGQFHHGWILSGPKGVGKATLAARIARAILNPDALVDEISLQVHSEAQVFRQLAAMAHPDVFVARREWDEKKGRLETEISVDRIRALTQFFSHTASGDGARVAIIDAADEMNRNAANALLKVLEEPPANTLLILVTNAPGRLLATIRSRCRVISLRPVKEETIRTFLQQETECDDTAAALAARACGGCPGYGLSLLVNDGAGALEDAERFIELARLGEDAGALIANYAGKSEESRWIIFRDHLLATLSMRARSGAVNMQDTDDPIPVQSYLEGWESLTKLSARGEGVNLDRASIMEAMAYDLETILRRSAHA